MMLNEAFHFNVPSCRSYAILLCVQIRTSQRLAMHIQRVLVLLSILHPASVSSHSLCFHCGDDARPKCPARMKVSLTDINKDKFCFGICVKFNGTVIRLPGAYRVLIGLLRGHDNGMSATWKFRKHRGKFGVLVDTFRQLLWANFRKSVGL